MTSCSTWSSSAPLRSRTCPSKCQWRTLECSNSMKVPYLYVSPVANMVGRVPSSPCFLVIPNLPSHTCSSSTRGQVSPWSAPTQPVDGRRGSNVYEGSVAELAEQQLPSGVTQVRSLLAAPLRCGSVTSVLNSLVG